MGVGGKEWNGMEWHDFTDAIVVHARDADERFDERDIRQGRESIHQLKNKYFRYQIVFVLCRVQIKTGLD